MNNISEHSRRCRSSKRADRGSTRSLIIDAAGRVFAEKGFAKTTTREICQKAGVNSAAVNYYFGSKEGLYDEVLVEAHRQIISLDQMKTIMEDSAMSDEDKLRFVFSLVFRTAANASGLWGIKVLMRELAFPSAEFPRSLKDEILPKAKLMRGLMGRLVNAPADSVKAAHAAFLVMMPCAYLLLFSEKIRSSILPELAYREEMVRSMHAYTMAGLSALRG
ncbi:MAG: TetR/AcrR family transcriptional regulator [Mailhella sp.]|nr:TetR/AcrR family transcriptional regulator [Mailhella sp.]